MWPFKWKLLSTASLWYCILSLLNKVVITFDFVNIKRGCPLQPAASRINQLLFLFFKDKLFVPLLVQIYENETYFPCSSNMDLKIIWLAHRFTILLVHFFEFWELHVENHWRREFAQIKLKSYDYFWSILTLLEICAQSQGNSISGDLKCKTFLGGGEGGMPPDTPSPSGLNNHYLAT